MDIKREVSSFVQYAGLLFYLVFWVELCKVQKLRSEFLWVYQFQW